MIHRLRGLVRGREPELYALTVFGGIGVVGMLGLWLGWWH